MYEGEKGKKAYNENNGVKKYPDFTDEMICKGSIALGTGCGTCSKCLFELSLLKSVQVPHITTAIPPVQQGWSCPLCGGVNSPNTSRCPCVPLPAPYSTC